MLVHGSWCLGVLTAPLPTPTIRPNGRHPPTNRHIHPKSHAKLALPMSRKASRCRRRNKRCKSGGYAAANFEKSPNFLGEIQTCGRSRVFPTSGGSSGRARARAQGSWPLQYKAKQNSRKIQIQLQITNTKKSHKMLTKAELKIHFACNKIQSAKTCRQPASAF